MSTTAEQPPSTELRSFDPSASIYLLRRDLEHEGRILPETMQRVRDEELTYIAEGLNRPLHTEFTLQRMDGDLVFFDNGHHRPYTGTLIKGLEVAKLEAKADWRKQFAVERAAEDLHKGYQLQRLRPGQRLRWYSDFPEDAAQRYGNRFVADMGYQPPRKMGFIYQAVGNPDGSVTLHSQSVDNSNEQAFAAAMSVGIGEGIEDMRAAYDRSLSLQRKGSYYAGRRLKENQESDNENAWELIARHGDILKYYFEQIEALARDETLSRDDLETAKKRLTYGTWAALKERMDRQAVHTGRDTSYDVSYEINQAYRALSMRGEVLFGCGGSIAGEAALLNADPQQVFEAIFGDKQEKLVWVNGVCRVDNCPTHPGKTKVAQCSVCMMCQKWFDKGRDPARLYSGARKVGRETIKKSETSKQTSVKKVAKPQTGQGKQPSPASATHKKTSIPKGVK